MGLSPEEPEIAINVALIAKNGSSNQIWDNFCFKINL